jgi:hypothetical protein
MNDWRSGENQRSLFRLEKQVKATFDDMGKEFLAVALAELDVVEKEIEVGGKTYDFAYRVPYTYHGLFGLYGVERSLYRPSDGKGPSICPLDMRVGIIEGTWTPAAAELMAYSAVLMTPYEAEEFFAKLGGLTPSKSSIDGLPKDLSKRLEEKREEWEGALRDQEVISKDTAAVALSLDGIMLPMKDGKRQEKRAESVEKGKETRGPAGCREAACGTVSLYDEEGERLNTIYYGRMPESKKVTLHAQLENELAFVLAQKPEAELAFIADGAKENWRIVSEIEKSLKDNGVIPAEKEVHKIADFWHSCEHLKTALDIYYGENSVDSRAKFAELRIVLRDQDGGAKEIVKKLRYYRNRLTGKRRTKLTTELKYFRDRIAHMDYAGLTRLKLPIGSGVVEAACKTLVTQRMKRSGMSWLDEGGQSVLSLRSNFLSGRWDSAWDLIAESYQPKLHIIKRKGHLVLMENVERKAA